MQNKGYEIKDYQSKRTFSSFLSGIAGKMGIPVWSFYVNRGQAITSFGIRDKNGAIMEFFPANAAYIYTKKIGFRTFVKSDNKYYEFFNKPNMNQSMFIRKDQLIIEEFNEDLGITVSVKYFTLPNEKSGALVRKVEITNNGKDKNIEIIDGLAQILSAGIDYGGYKAISNLLQSWMQVEKINNSLFFKLRGTTNDSSQVGVVVDGNYYMTFTKDNLDFNYLYDNKVIFDYDTALDYPYKFMKLPLDELLKEEECPVNQVPGAYTAIKTKLKNKIEFISLIGYAHNKDFLEYAMNKYSYNYLSNKELENESIHNDLTSVIETNTNYTIYDDYLKQNYLDNILRGGVPLVFETKNGLVGYHIYSRKHGDLERDYNFFSLEPKYYSQGNGNFRDVLQNRRNDLIFNPELKDSNIYQFASLIQADGYNPLSIEGIKFKYNGGSAYPDKVNNILEKEFTPGDLAIALEESDLEIESNLREIIKQSEVIIKATFGEGYWGDHFTYLDDCLDSVESIYPDQIKNILFDDKKYAFYNSGIYVKPRKEKYVLTDDKKVRQYHSIEHLNKTSDWLKDKDDKVIKVNLIGKLVTLVVNKYAILDPANIGISYEADKPGWNDAMNGIPGLFGSGVSETIEVRKLAKRVLRYLNEFSDEDIYLIKETNEFINELKKVDFIDSIEFWDKRLNIVENYRINLKNNKLEETKVKASDLIEFIEKIINVFNKGIEKAEKLNEIIPTYLVFEPIKYELIDKNFVKVNEFELRALPSFLEGPARLLKTIKNPEKALNIYEKIKVSDLYDKQFKFYKTSVDLTDETPEIGRIKAFTKGWLERESNFLHMTYKYLYALLVSGLYEKFFEEIRTNYTCFMDPEIYGRPPIENSSFIAPSNNPDQRKQGQGFVSRLTGSTAEMLSMWSHMFFGPKLFSYENNQLIFEIKPKLSKDFFINNMVSTTLFGVTKVVIFNKDLIDTYDKEAKIEKIKLIDFNNNEKEFNGNKVFDEWASKIRQKSIYKIEIYISKEERK